MANAKYIALVGVEDASHRAEPGDTITWLNKKSADPLLKAGLIEHASEVES
jgi:hypothetical protein